MRYYSTQRPVTPGSIPKPDDNSVLTVSNFDEPQEVDGKGMVYGTVDYLQPLTDEQWVCAELIPEDYRYWYGVTTTEISGRPETRRGTLGPVSLSAERPAGRTRLTLKTGKLIRKRWFRTQEEAEAFLRTGEEAAS